MHPANRPRILLGFLCTHFDWIVLMTFVAKYIGWYATFSDKTDLPVLSYGGFH